MKTFGKFSRIAAAAAVSGAVMVPASAALAGDKTERAVIGAVLGGVAGAALSNGDGGATAVGAVAGAAIGAATADNNRNDRYRRAYRTQRPYYSDTRYRTYDRGYYNRGYDNRGYSRDGYRYGGRYSSSYAPYGYYR